MSGWEVLAELRDLEPQSKVVICTGQVEGSAEVTGVQGVIYKPFSLDVLVRTMREVLDA